MKGKGRIQFDVKQLKEILAKENTYIVELWKKLPFQQNPGNSNVDQDVLTHKDRPGGLFHSGKSRAKTVAELHSRLEELKGKKLQYKERLLKKGLKNRLIKKRRKEDRKVQRALTTISQQKSAFKPIEKKAPKPVFNSEGKMVFSKFDFTVADKEKNKSKGPKDPQVILKKLEERKERLQQLKEEGHLEQAAAIKAKQDWRTALQRAEGMKIKDDPKLLKKSVQRELERKKRSEKKWKKREEIEQQKQTKQQEKRQAHIDERTKKRKVRKVKRLVKHGRLIQGVNV